MDLRELMEARSANPAASVLHHLRMDGVRRRVVARRRRRVVAGALAVAVAAVLAVAGPPDLPGFDRSLSPAEGEVEGFAEYRDGNRVIAAASARLADDLDLEFTFVPSTEDFTIYWRCDNPPPWWDPVVSSYRGLYLTKVEFWLNGVLFMTNVGDIGCDAWRSPMDYSRSDVSDWGEEFDLRIGEPNTLIVRLTGPFTGEPDGPPVRVPRRADWGVAVAEPVPFERYVFPPRPDELEPIIEPSERCDPLYPYRWRSDPADPMRPVRATIELRHYRVEALAQTPGFLTVRINGVEAGRVEQWTYQPGAAGNPSVYLDPGILREAGLDTAVREQVSITIAPEHMTGEWLVLLTPNLSTTCL